MDIIKNLGERIYTIQSNNLLITIDGDSITAAISSWHKLLPNLIENDNLPASINETQNAVGGSTWITAQNRGSTVDAQAISDNNILILMLGVNDISYDGVSGATTLARAQSYLNDRASSGVWQSIYAWEPTALNGCNEVDGQPIDPGTAAQFDNEMDIFISGLRQLNHLTGVIPRISEMTDSSNTNYFGSFGIHPNDTLQVLIGAQALNFLKKI